ncbi:MAG: hypothetical protein ABSH38_03620 [Verrucomicrobiota bacterium]|jgi:hypothetical protein
MYEVDPKSQHPKSQTQIAKSAEESRAGIRVPPGFKVEIVASEPLIESPVAFEWGADGKLWVVEIRDYPSGTGGGGGEARRDGSQVPASPGSSAGSTAWRCTPPR